jgi:hypothetical protein
MISHKHRYIFVHIPKCGGTSIEKLLLKIDGISLPEGDRPLKYLAKSTGDEYLLGRGRQHFTIRQYPENDYFRFAFVRNPWSRMVSEYAWRKRIYNYPDNAFRQFILDPPLSKSANHLWPQSRFLDDEMDFIGRFENLQGDFDLVMKVLGLPRQQLTHENPTRHRPYSEYYDQETAAVIAERYRDDIDRFGYDFGQ